MQAYSNPKRESDPHALPDLEVWEDNIWEVHCKCGVYDIFEGRALADDDDTYCPSCDKPAELVNTPGRSGWFYWYCFPGCMPDSDFYGPFSTEAEALADARENSGDDDE